MSTKKKPPVKGKKAGGLLAEIIAASGISPNKGEAFNEYAERACQVIGGFDDDAFGKLSKDAQGWYETVVDLNQKKKPEEYPALDGYTEAAGGGETKEEKPAAEKPTKAKKTAPVKAAKAPVKKKAAEAKPAKKAAKKAPVKAAKKAPVKKATQGTLPGVEKGGKAPGKRVDSVAYKMRLQVVKKPTIEFEAAAKAAGVEAERGSNAWNAYFNARQVMAIVQELAAKK